jgi:membrane protein YqaA with SNARE-associated domain
MLFFLPAALDTVIVVMVARHRDLFWLIPLLGTLGSLVGATITYVIGRKIGQAGLSRWISKARLDKVRKKLEDREVVAIAVAAVLPPPFPLTPFVLTSGALGIDKRKFYISLGAMRFVRFGGEAILALIYGRHILKWLESDFYVYTMTALIILAFVGSVVTIVQTIKRIR